MEITIATLNDIDKLCELLDSLFAQEAEFLPDRGAQARGLATVINGTEVGDILIARNNGEIIAMVNLLYTVSTALGEPVALLEDMVVSPNGRGQGVGSKLIRQAIEFAKGKGCKRITLLTDDDNNGAHRFYEKHGFSRSPMVTFRMPLDGE
ncbi:MAG: GNAT family N-acetyltransferase [Gammaproteobacteria bacterium]|nr:GNAT family N-acetyltransferase [Gammaproteobacteria bacterium]